MGNYKNDGWNWGRKRVYHVSREEREKKDKQVEEVKMLSDKIDEPLLDLDKCSLHRQVYHVLPIWMF